ncbi:DUF4411 domain-containing protein [Bacillaceae bacterium W0354]
MKKYTLDTNVFRHRTNSRDQNSLEQKGAKLFWRKIKDEINQNKAMLLIPKEVIRELTIQSYTLKPKQVEKINELKTLCTQTIPDYLTEEIENVIIEMSAYVRAEFKDEMGQQQLEYPSISDSRILYSAYCEDSILVTSNIRDFMIYPLLFPQSEECLYNLKTNKFVKIPEDGYKTIHNDGTFQDLLNRFYKLSNGNE